PSAAIIACSGEISSALITSRAAFIANRPDTATLLRNMGASRVNMTASAHSTATKHSNLVTDASYTAPVGVRAGAYNPTNETNTGIMETSNVDTATISPNMGVFRLSTEPCGLASRFEHCARDSFAHEYRRLRNEPRRRSSV